MSDIRDATYLDKRVGDMPREELFEVMQYLADRLQELDTSTNHRAIGLGRVEMIKRGEL